MTDMGEYHDPELRLERPVRIERTDIAQDDFDKTLNITRRIMQSVIAESPYHSYPTTLDDGIWDSVHRLEEQNGLPEGITAHDAYQFYIRTFHHE